MSAPSDMDIQVPITSDADLARVRQQVREAAVKAGFGLVQQTKVVTAASELARNTLVHGGGGRMEMSERPGLGGAVELRLRFCDDGPGIANVEQALTDGWTSGNGMGLGLGGARRLVHEFSLETTPGRGTTVTISAWSTPTPPPQGAGW
ncbi:anti-sigma regulatory factor [Streptomyces sp. ICBB 8177]|uniref:anti-sigma regulatory factor n=1 Tax=Streptomyces sp. ICBB 8177 TaxID=563922 RepID=UPI000D6813D3|nr:anti-sigma regulatory factor [Streptomyces sp. ICBB 8177]PWI45148.1 anti-sigma regulatory factor [Streptomyces sp. ICBB 8177]